ncbi:MAG: flagellar export protein FliJ [Oscillospiraceae bacterium]|nr:flagellar export protein FliJ [Oscillospiraceae bacterium]
MKKFSFSLDKVLDYKQQILESVQAEHAAAIAEVQRQEEVLQEAWHGYRAYNEEFCESKKTGLLITEALFYESRLRAMEAKIQQETKQLEKLREIEEQKRSVVIEAKKETASLEKLKEKKLGLYQKAVQKSEEAFIEEFVSNSRAFTHSA